MSTPTSLYLSEMYEDDEDKLTDTYATHFEQDDKIFINNQLYISIDTGIYNVGVFIYDFENNKNYTWYTFIYTREEFINAAECNKMLRFDGKYAESLYEHLNDFCLRLIATLMEMGLRSYHCLNNICFILEENDNKYTRAMSPMLVGIIHRYINHAILPNNLNVKFVYPTPVWKTMRTVVLRTLGLPLKEDKKLLKEMGTTNLKKTLTGAYFCKKLNVSKENMPIDHVTDAYLNFVYVTEKKDWQTINKI